MRRFLLTFLAAFVALELSWFIVGPGYRGFFRALTSAIFCGSSERRELTLETLPKDSPGLADTRLFIVNPRLMTPDGAGPVRNVDFETRALGWVPSSLFVALVLATPGMARRRLWILLGGIFVIHVYALIALGYAIWNESAAVSLAHVPEAWAPTVNRLQQALLGQLALAVPVMAWAVGCFRFASSTPATGDREGSEPLATARS
jgi:hypothetical protein